MDLSTNKKLTKRLWGKRQIMSQNGEREVFNGQLRCFEKLFRQKISYRNIIPSAKIAT